MSFLDVLQVVPLCLSINYFVIGQILFAKFLFSEETIDYEEPSNGKDNAARDLNFNN
jgi:hypothetical protein